MARTRTTSHRARTPVARSRGWTYDDVFLAEAPLPMTSCDVLDTETTDLCVQGPAALEDKQLFASVVPVSDRVEKEPLTFFWQPDVEIG